MNELELFQTETAAFLEGIVRHITEAITVIDEQGRILFANKPAAEICGYDSVAGLMQAGGIEILSRFDLLDESDTILDASRLPGRRVFDAPESSAAETVKFRSKDTGQIRWTRIRSSAFTHPATGLRLSVNVFEDVTEEVRETHRREFLLEASRVLASVVDYDSRLRSLAQLCVPRFSDWCGIHIVNEDGTVAQAAVAHVDAVKVELARSVSERIPYNPNADHGVGRVIRTGRPELIERVPESLFQQAALDDELLGLIMDLEIRSVMCVPLRARGRTLGAIMLVGAESGRTFTEADLQFAQDFATLAATEVDNARLYRQAQRSFAQIDAVLSQMGDPVIFSGPDGNVIFLNQAALDVFGPVDVGDPWVAGDSQATTNDGDPISPDELPLNRACRGERVAGYRWRVTSANGSVVYLESYAVPVFGEDGVPLGAVAVDRNITVQIDLQHQKELFLVSAAHDLKNPITEVKATAQFLMRTLQRSEAERQADDAMVAKLSRIDGATNRMVQILDQLLDVTRLDMGGTLELNRRDVDLAALTRQTVAEVKGIEDDHDITFTDESSGAVGTWDEARLQRVIHNLLSNAVKYSPAGSVVSVRVWTEEAGASRYACVSVTDEGAGIPEADLPFIFDSFRRGRNVEGSVSGSGIGLAGVQQILQQHGGSVEVVSTEDVGSTFTVRLPLGS